MIRPDAPQAGIGSLVTSGLTLFDYQKPAVAYLVSHPRAMIVAGCGLGKTPIVVAAIVAVVASKARARKPRVLWVGNTREQIDQAESTVDLFAGLREAVELVTACPAGAPIGETWDLIVFDEGHHLPARTWRKLVEGHRGALWIVTATPWTGDPERDAVLRGFCEGNVYTVSAAAAASRRVAARVFLLPDTDRGIREPIDREVDNRIRRRMAHGSLPFEEVRRQVLSRVALDMGVIGNCARNDAIVRTAIARSKDSTLVIVPGVDHGAVLASRIPGAVLAHSKMGARARRDAIGGFRAGDVRCMVATSLADEGLDCPLANVLILAAAGRSSARVEQRCGRVLRAVEGKSHGSVYDFEDSGHPLLAKWSRDRQAVFRRLGYSIQQPTPHMELAAR